jgi:hypothetical protein
MAEYKLSRSLEINAPAAVIWDALADVKSWPSWKPFIRSVRFAGDAIEVGSRFTMNIKVKGPAVPITVTVIELDRGRKMAWTGGLRGLSMSVHGFVFEESGGKTRVTSYEHFTGALVSLMLLIVTPRDLAELHDKWLDAIKHRVEKS